MALIDHFMPALAFAAMLASEKNLADVPFETARADMDRLLDQALEEARQERGRQIDNALFAVCAFADEIILSSAWAGRNQWLGQKLQQIRFRTASAGEEFFARLSRLQDDAAAPGDGDIEPGCEESDGAREVLEVYLACLALGFRGQYFGPEGMAHLESLTRSNLERFHAGSPLQEETVFPEAYSTPLPAVQPPSGLKRALTALFLFGAPALLAAGVYGAYSIFLSTYINTWLRAFL